MIRKATMADAKNIKKILGSYAKKGLLLDRSFSSIYDSLRDFFVLEIDGKFAGCCALHFFWDDLAEIRSLAVKQKFMGTGYGKKLVQACLEEAKSFGLNRVFTLAFVPKFFLAIGFKELEKDKLPHKIWADCLNCVDFPDCKEIAMEKKIN